MILVFWVSAPSTYGADYNVGSISDLNAKIANAVKGDVIILQNGSYSGSIQFDCTALNGTADEPTNDDPSIVKAETPGQVQLTGGSLTISGNHLIWHGFYVTSSENVYATFINAQHCRITNCKFENNKKVIELRGTDRSRC